MNTFKKSLVALTSITLLSGLAACSSPDAPEAPTTVVTVTASAEAPVTEEAVDPISYNESDVVSHMGMTEDYGSYYLKDPATGAVCEAAVVLTTASGVSLYADAGDNVATNLDRTAGVKDVSAESDTCMALFNERLVDFPLADGETKEPYEEVPIEEIQPQHRDDVENALIQHLGQSYGAVEVNGDEFACLIENFITYPEEMEWAIEGTNGVSTAVISDPTGTMGVLISNNDGVDACTEYFVDALSTFTFED